MIFALPRALRHLLMLSTALPWLCFGLCSAQAESFSYATLGNLVLQSEPAIKQAQAISTKWSDPRAQDASVQESDLAVKIPSRYQQQRLAFQLAHTFAPLPATSSVMDIDAVNALALISKSHPAARCLLDIFPTKTVFGKVAVARNLALPLTNRRELTRRQQAVKTIVHDPHLQRTLHEIMSNITLQEPILLSCFDPNDTMVQKIFDSMYFKNPAHNTSIVKLAIKRAYQTLDSDPSLVFPRTILLHLKSLTFIKLNRMIDRYCFDIRIGKIQDTAPDIRWYQLGKWVDYHLLGTEEVTQSDAGELRWYLFTAAGILVQTGLEYLLQQLKPPLVDEAIAHMKSKLKTIAACIESIEKLHALLLADEVLRGSAPEVNAALTIFVNDTAEEFLKLKELLNSSTFKGEPGYLDSARILVAFKLFEEQKDLFIPVFEAIGTLDALTAAAELYTSRTLHYPGSYCFVDYVDTPQPTITLEDFSNPLLRPDEAVVNSVHLGADGDRNLIITGPNGSGKSVFMKSIALNLVLAQSCGIAAARTATISPFDTFHIYLNIQENLELSLSTFMAEKKKLDGICLQITKQPAGHKSFALIDEGLKGTVEQSGGPLMYQAGLAISQAPGTICLFATHFNKPTELEEATQQAFVNCHLELLETNEGEFERTFRLKKEKNSWWFTDDAKRERFMVWLSNLALAS